MFDFFYRETLPRLDNYRISMRNLKRPSIGELQGEAADQVSLEWDRKIDGLTVTNRKCTLKYSTNTQGLGYYKKYLSNLSVF